MNLYEQLISQAPDIDCVLAITKIRPSARWGNNALIEDSFTDLDNSNQLPTVQDILTAWSQVKAEQAAAAQVVSVEKKKEALYSAWVAQGFNAGSFKLRVGKEDQLSFAMLLISENNIGTEDDVFMDIESMDKGMQKISFGDFKAIMKSYSAYCYASWKASKGVQ